MDPVSDGPDPFRTMVSCIHSGHCSQKSLCRTNIGGCFLPLDMLFAGLKRHPQCIPSVHILRNPNNPAGKIPFIFITGCKERGNRSTVTHRYTETL